LEDTDMKRMLARCALIAIAGGAALAITACAGDSPVSPEGLAARSALSRQSSQVNAGIYQLSFYTNGLVPVTTLVAGSGSELILGALVTDVAGAPAQGGSVTFQYCSLKGLPPNDITRADEAPSSACASGDGDWARLTTVPVDASGHAYMDFGIVMLPRTIGFRFAYTRKGGAVSSGVSAPADFTWVAG
jgi:hypothetical protein